MNKSKKDVSIIRSSTAEYLTCIASTGDSKESVEMRYENENIWLTQKLMSTLYDVSVSAINQHIKKIYDDKELTPNATIKKYLIVQQEGNREVSRNVDHYNLQMIIAVGFKVNNERAVQFRKWANGIVKEFTIKGWIMDTERLKNGHFLSDKYFEEQLARIREIRMSERKFYQKITDIYATSMDYDKNANTTKRFYATVQNKLHWAIHTHTAAELIMKRADHQKENMGLTSWQDAPDGKIKTTDVVIAKNYLNENELKQLERIVTMYLDYAEDMTLRKIPMTMQDWEKRLNAFLQFNDREILMDNGKVTAEIAKSFALSEFEKYRVVQDRLFESDFDKFIMHNSEGTVDEGGEDSE